MKAAAWLGLRLSVAGGWRRPLSMTLASALGTFLLLIGLALPGATSSDDPAQPQQRLAVVTVLIAIGVPVALLLLAVNRLSAQLRDQRLARLRLLGLSAPRVRVVAAAENAVFAALGAFVGAIAYAVSAPSLSRAVLDRTSWVSRPLAVSTSLAATAVVAVVALAVAISLAPHRTVSSSGLATRDEGRRPAPTPARLLPLLVGLGIIAWVGTRSVSPEFGPSDGLLMLFLVGSLLTAVGMVLSLGLVATALAELIGRLSPAPTILLAVRRQATEPTSTVRLVTGLLMAVFVVTLAMAPLAAFESVTQYAAVTEIEAEGPQKTDLLGEGVGSEADVAQLGVMQGVLGVSRRVADGGVSSCGPVGDPGACGNVAVMTCAEAVKVFGLGACREDRATFIRLDPAIAPAGVDNLRLSHRDGETDVPATSVDVAASRADIWQMGPSVSLIPPSVAMSASLPLADGGLEVWTDATGRADAPIAQWARAHDAEAFAGWKLTWAELQGLRTLVRGIGAVLLGLGLLTVLITALDRAIERRRAVARLVAIGVPPRVLRGAQTIQTALSLIPGLVLAIAGGVAGGYAYVNLNGRGSPMPWDSWTVVAVVAIMGGMVVTVATLAGVGARLRPESLRRE